MSDIVERLCFLPLVHSLPVGVADVTSDAATEITRLRAQLTGRIEDIRVQEETILAVRKERDALRAQVAALEGDAGRYRWLREHSGEFQGPEIFVNGKYELGSDLDAAIDAAVNHPPQPAQPAPRTADCLMCGHCAAMSNTIPLPPIVERADEHYHGEGLADAVHAHAAAVTAERDARIKVLEDALVEVLEFQSAPTQPTIHDWGCWRRVLHARAALGDKTPNVRANLPP